MKQRTVSTIAILVLAFWTPAIARSLKLGNEADVRYDLRGRPKPDWSNGSFTGVEANQTAVPSILLVDPIHGEVRSFVFSIPGVTSIDIRSTYYRENNIALCGSASDSTGRASGFFASITTSDGSAKVTHVGPYTHLTE